MQCAQLDLQVSQTRCFEIWNDILIFSTPQEFSMMNKTEILEIISLSETLKSTRPGSWISHISTAFKENKLLAAIQNYAIYIKLPPFFSSTAKKFTFFYSKKARFPVSAHDMVELTFFFRFCWVPPSRPSNQCHAQLLPFLGHNYRGTIK